MSGEEAVASKCSGVGAHGSVASPDNYESVTELLDAVHRASFEDWWTHVHGAGRAHRSGPVATSRTQYPGN
jgi:hypothetical protein